MPCVHQLSRRLAEKKTIVKEDFHRFWWLGRSLDIEYPILQVKEPLVMTVLKDRPKRTGPFRDEAATVAPPSSAPAAIETARPL